MIEKEEKQKKEYKNPVLFLRKSKQGEHLYAFNRIKDLEKMKDNAEEGLILGKNVGSLLLNISEVVKLVDGKVDWIKISVLPPREDAEEEATGKGQRALG